MSNLWSWRRDDERSINDITCDSDSISDWDNFFIFDSFQIVSACGFRNVCARLIFIELFINKISLHSFFFSSLSLYKLMCVDARVVPFVYYKNDFFRILKGIRSLIIRWQQEFYWDLMFAFCMQYVCFTIILQYFTFFIYDFLILKTFVIFCSNSINVYCWQIHTCVFSALLRRLFNDDPYYYALFFIFWWLCFKFVNVF